ncbi:MAG: IS200/IS605 family transposase [Acidobacteria bacterium]|nr:IS200/IS605 family transposase [Acidobacteriota bacterium]
MANTYSALFYHLVFSTKNRANLIHPEIEERIWAYVGGIARAHKLTAIQIGGIENHLHGLIMAPPTIAPFEIAKALKVESSKWIHEQFSELANFAWQDGYGAFTVSKTNVPDVMRYIQNQRIHHQTEPFENEYVGFLKRAGVDYDERYLWG